MAVTLLHGNADRNRMMNESPYGAAHPDHCQRERPVRIPTEERGNQRKQWKIKVWPVRKYRKADEYDERTVVLEGIVA